MGAIVLMEKFPYLSQPGIDFGWVDQQADTLPSLHESRDTAKQEESRNYDFGPWKDHSSVMHQLCIFMD